MRWTCDVQDEEIGCCVLQQLYQGHAFIQFRFPPCSVLPALGTVTVWSGCNRPSSCDYDGPNINFIFRELGSWSAGVDYTTYFRRANGEVRHCCRSSPMYIAADDLCGVKLQVLK